VALIHIEEASIVYQKQIQGLAASGINSMQFVKFVLEGFEKNILLVATEDSSILAIEEDTGNGLSPNTVQTKNPSRSLLMHVLGELPIFVLSVLLSYLNYTGFECMNFWHFFSHYDYDVHCTWIRHVYYLSSVTFYSRSEFTVVSHTKRNIIKGTYSFVDIFNNVCHVFVSKFHYINFFGSHSTMSQITEEEQCLSENQNVSTEKSFEGTTSKHSLLVLCSENAVRIYSLSHVIQVHSRIVVLTYGT
jgi:hypothetical protein